jgi:cation diffusion facilitator CzcD-associated flavoprotein CzcO
MTEILFDVIVVGAGYSGLAAGYHLKEHRFKSYHF